MDTGDGEIYRELQRRLDRMPVPFPATESGVEIRILKRLFTPEEARLALELSAIPEKLGAIHARVKHEIGENELRAALDAMADKGAIQKLPGKDGPLYAKAPLVVGMYEAQVNRLTPEFETDMRAYLEEDFGRALYSMPTPQMRTVPVYKSISVDRAVASYDDIRKFTLETPGPFAALNCVCKQGKDLTGDPCRLTGQRQTCLMYGVAATMMIAKAGAREVSREGMLELLDEADRVGLVLQPQNTQDPLFVCCCCGCCCGVLATVKKWPRPVDAFQTNFVAKVDADACEICGACVARCQMDAITSGSEPAAVAEERCIGCGLCVSTCPSGAVKLHKKDGKKPPPRNTQALYLRMFRDRYGTAGAAGAVAGHLLGRKF